MKIFTDSIYMKGDSHITCQDYAMTGESPIPFTVVCDGCSGAENSDLGARLLAHAVPRVIDLMGIDGVFSLPAQQIAYALASRAKEAVEALGAEPDCLHATLLLALFNPASNKIRIIMVGDGFLAIKPRDQDPVTLAARFTLDLPFYPYYLLDENMVNKFSLVSEQKGQEYTACWSRTPPFDFTENPGVSPIFDITLSAEAVDWLMLASDGLDTFREKDPFQRLYVGLGGVMPKWINIKQSRGKFVSRRVNKMVLKELHDLVFDDDLSVAGISFHREED